MHRYLEPRVLDDLHDVAIARVATRGSHVVAVSEEGSVYTWGRGDEGQLGHNTKASLHVPTKVPDLEHIVQVACGRAHSVAIDLQGRLYSWGSGEDGALGIADAECSLVPLAIPHPASFQAIECGSRHTLALSSDNRVFAWGWGLYGQLGLGHSDTVRQPTEIPSFIGKRVVQISCGFRHCFAVVPAGIDGFSPTVDVYGWGWNQYGQLGELEKDGSPDVVLRPVRCSALMDVNLTLLAAGGRHSLACVDGDTFAWGRGGDGELGTGTVSNERHLTSIPMLHQRSMHQVACGWAHSAALYFQDTSEAPAHAMLSPSSWSLTSGDWDAFSGMLVQSILQLMIIYQVLPAHCGLPVEVVTTRIIPAAAFTTTMGNCYFAFAGWRLARDERRNDVTGLPEGVNTVLVFAYGLSIMAPEYQATQSFEAAWEAGLFAAIWTALLQMALLPFVSFLQRSIPKAALLASVSGIALTFLSMGFAFEIWENPLIALGPLFLFLVCYGAGVKLPFHLPTGLGSLLLGTLIAFVLYYTGASTNFVPMTQPYVLDLQGPHVDMHLVWRALTSGAGWKYMSIIMPMVLVNVMSAIANFETAAAVGDKYDPITSVLGDSIVTILGACLGNPFPTGVYIGHPIYKAMGARNAYLGMNAICISLLAILNATPWIIGTIPISSGVGFLLWIGMVITASSFEKKEQESNHGTAVVLGMVPALSAWGFQLVQNTLTATSPNGFNMTRVVEALSDAGLNPNGMIALSQGYLLTAIVLASTMVHIIERDFIYASLWMLIASILSGTGVIHAFEVEASGIQPAFGVFPTPWSFQFCLVYLGLAVLLWVFQLGEDEHKYTWANLAAWAKLKFSKQKPNEPRRRLYTQESRHGSIADLPQLRAFAEGVTRETTPLLRSMDTMAENAHD
ncbi:hypothetical protein SPRG_01203 [Saprolegnia parasitica CBS 223.65]|uniref:RCC1-like domain-containing protein n=1 Tax=Saprolegnia parasitica (strain CBS 223.65) TaxID=695850 RepID=A0A067D931_SAPPC|nr:hypothetical protein SPRG_01203 [Saprolegnia parasitica CBS 223.65]KDO35136.1 hypothetical protein SPRG_01203 [Saprolegnia parasitica CBS 223.65]|eukprot:XP_012194785.1 hypothetical protein SPRG_01203 [Saprolegnia parasitica CBS 223.65]